MRLILIFIISFNLHAAFPGYRIPPAGDVMIPYGKSSTHAIAKEFSLLSWNIYKGERGNFLKDFQKLTTSMDIVLLQEFYTLDTLVNQLNQQQTWEFALATSFENMRAGKRTGVLSGSTTSAQASIFIHSIYREPIVQTPKVTLISLWPMAECNTDLMVVNTHAINFVSNSKFRADLDHIALSIIGHQGPLIWAGDFNTWNGGRMAKLKKVAQQLGLVFAKLKNAAFVKKFAGYPLDHILYRGLKLRNAQVHKEIASSDHRPLSATFEHFCNQTTKLPPNVY